MYLEEAQESIHNKEDIVYELKTLHRVVVLGKYQTARRFLKTNILHQRSSYKAVYRESIHDELPYLWESLILINKIPLFKRVVGVLAIEPILIIQVIVVHHRHLYIRLVRLSDSKHDDLLPKVTPCLLPQVSDAVFSLFVI